VFSKQIELLDALVGAHTAAYLTDRHVIVANPAVPSRLRELMHQLAELTFERDGRSRGGGAPLARSPDLAS
jgi:hypothetical protein